MDIHSTQLEPSKKEASVFNEPEREASWMQVLSVETTGIQRVTDEERLVRTTKFWNACTFWYGLIYPLLNTRLGVS